MFILRHKPTDSEEKSVATHDKRLHRPQHGTSHSLFGFQQQILMTYKTRKRENRRSRGFHHCLVVLCLVTQPTLEMVTRNDWLDGSRNDHLYDVLKSTKSLSIQPTSSMSFQNEPTHQEMTRNKQPKDIANPMASATSKTRNNEVSIGSDEEGMCLFEQAFYAIMSNNHRTMATTNEKWNVKHHWNCLILRKTLMPHTQYHNHHHR
jgi:hypothetical protein